MTAVTDIDMNREECENNVNLTENRMPVVAIANNLNAEDEGVSKLEPYVGLEFNTADDAREFYSLYAAQIGFKVRIGQLYRSRSNGSVSSRRFVCSKEGFQVNSRTGCQAFIRVQRVESGKWVIDNFKRDHNHELEFTEGMSLSLFQTTAKSLVNGNYRQGIRLLEVDGDEDHFPSGLISFKRLKTGERESEAMVEPYLGQEFSSANEAYRSYNAYAASMGFKIRIGQLFRSRDDGLIAARRFVCSKEGHQHSSRVGCGAFIRVKKQVSGMWVVDRFIKDHNHDLDPPREADKKIPTALVGFRDDASGGLENLGSVETNDASHPKRSQESNIGSNWYDVLLEYFQSRQVEDTGFFYAVELDDGRCRSVFWADGRSRFSGSQFGDAIVFDTSYRKSNYSVPFATFIGVNHHKQPVLLGCALIADESKESFTWVLRTWFRAMSGRRPLSIIADQDKAIRQAIAQVFPGIHHRFSAWQIKAKERENLGRLLSIDSGFKYDYDKCIYQSQTAAEFDAAWNALLSKYHMKGNAWLKEMYDKRESWVPLYLRGTFFAGIPVNGGIKSFFGSLLNAQTPIREFILQYERGLSRRREEERQDDFDSCNLQTYLHTKEMVEEQGRRLYTLTVFKVFQKELMDSYGYLGVKISEEGIISRYLVRKCANDNEKHIVTLNGSNLNVICSCQMFEFEGVLCRHVLKVFQLVNIRDIPSCYILHRWTKNAKYGFVGDAETESGGSSQDLKAMMLWGLREEACNYIGAGVASVERYKLALEIMLEGRRKISQHN